MRHSYRRHLWVQTTHADIHHNTLPTNSHFFAASPVTAHFNGYYHLTVAAIQSRTESVCFSINECKQRGKNKIFTENFTMPSGHIQKNEGIIPHAMRRMEFTEICLWQTPQSASGCQYVGQFKYFHIRQLFIVIYWSDTYQWTVYAQ